MRPGAARTLERLVQRGRRFLPRCFRVAVFDALGFSMLSVPASPAEDFIQRNVLIHELPRGCNMADADVAANAIDGLSRQQA